MSKQVVESPEFTRLYWAVMAIVGLVILNSLFSCTPEPAQCVECPEDYVAKYWFLLIVPTAILGLITWKIKAPFPKAAFALLTLTSFCLLVVPYMLMFALWVMTELIP